MSMASLDDMHIKCKEEPCSDSDNNQQDLDDKDEGRSISRSDYACVGSRGRRTVKNEEEIGRCQIGQGHKSNEMQDCGQALNSIINAVAQEDHNLGQNAAAATSTKRKRSAEYFRCGKLAKMEKSEERRTCADDSNEDWETEDEDDVEDCNSKCQVERRLLRNEIKLLKSKVDRLLQRQGLWDDFGMMEYGTRFKTFHDARERLLKLPKIQMGSSDPGLVLAPGSPHLINVLTRICGSENSTDIKVVAEEVANEYRLNLRNSRNPAESMLNTAVNNGTESSKQPSSNTTKSQKPQGPIANFLASNSHLLPNPYFTTLPPTNSNAKKGTLPGISSCSDNSTQHIQIQRLNFPPAPKAPCSSTSDPASDILYSYDRRNRTERRMLLAGKNNQHPGLDFSTTEHDRLKKLIQNQDQREKLERQKDAIYSFYGQGQNQNRILHSIPIGTSAPSFNHVATRAEFGTFNRPPLPQTSQSPPPPVSRASSPSSYTNRSQIYFCSGQSPDLNVGTNESQIGSNTSNKKPKKKRAKRKKQSCNSNFTPVRSRTSSQT